MVELDTTAELSPAAEAVRANLLAGLCDVPTFASALGKTDRAVQAWMTKGLPHVRVGNTPYVVIDEAKRWLFSRATTPATAM
jgi:hypothetical protein